MMAVGVARMKAQGQKTTSTVTERMNSRVKSPVTIAIPTAASTIQVAPFIRETDDRRFVRVRFFGETDHPLEGTVGTDLRGLSFQSSRID